MFRGWPPPISGDLCLLRLRLLRVSSSEVLVSVMASDGRATDRVSESKPMSSGFQWVSPSPAPEVVERLVSSFPEVVRVPVEELEVEMAGWQSSAIIARSFNRWVPAAAFVREFRRAGVQGEITPISLAFRCHIFRFEDPKAGEWVLNRPWVVNGQVIGMVPWKPEFIPAEDAVSSALVWVRLPNLPMEFWKVEFLRLILEPAGEFVCADASTVAKCRGGFARACIRTDFRRPLRPGTRIQGLNLPFWQQFAYENVEGICSYCGSIHLDGPCSLSSGTVVEESEHNLIYGPWIAALRQRRVGSDGRRDERRKQVPRASSGAAGEGVSALKSQAERRPGAVDAEGWCSPVKLARRRLPVSSKAVMLPAKDQANTAKGLSSGESGSLFVPVEGSCAGSELSKEGLLGIEKEGPKVSELIQPMQIENPFASLGSGPGAVGLQVSRDAFPGPLKRPRSVDGLAPRSVSKSEKRKGKGKKTMTMSSGGSLVSSDCFKLASNSQVGGNETECSCPDKAVNSLSEVPPGEVPGLRSGSQPLTQSTVLGIESEGQKSGSPMITEVGTSANGGLSDIAMGEDQGGVLASSSL